MTGIATTMEENWGRECSFVEAATKWLHSADYIEKAKDLPKERVNVDNLDYANIFFQEEIRTDQKTESQAYQPSSVSAFHHLPLSSGFQKLRRRLKELELSLFLKEVVNIPEAFPLTWVLALFSNSLKHKLREEGCYSRFTIEKSVRKVSDYFCFSKRAQKITLSREIKLCFLLSWSVVTPAQTHFLTWMQELQDKSLWLSAQVVPRLQQWYVSISCTSLKPPPKTLTCFLALIWSKLAATGKLTLTSIFLKETQKLISLEIFGGLKSSFPSALAVEKMLMTYLFDIDAISAINQIVHSLISLANTPPVQNVTTHELTNKPQMRDFLQKKRLTLKIIETIAFIIIITLLPPGEILRIFCLEFLVTEAEITPQLLRRSLICYRNYLEKHVLLASDTDISCIVDIITRSSSL